MRKRCLSFLAILGGVLLALGRTEARQAITTNLAAYWPMDSFAANATPDASGNGHAAVQTTVGNQPAPATGIVGGALNFDDTTPTGDSLSAPDSAGLNVGTGSFTVAAWVKPSGTTADRILNKWNGSIGWLFDINTGTGGANSAAKVRLKMSDGGTGSFDQSANAGLFVGAWTHVAATVNRAAGQVKFYSNGVQLGATLPLGTIGTLNNSAALGIGTIPMSTGNYYGGALDEVRLYTAALTQPEVMSLVAPLPPTALTANPVAKSITLNWTASTGSMFYRVYRSLASGSGFAPYEVGLTGTTYTDTAIDYDVTYYYVVRGFGLVESLNSNEAFATAVRPPPGTTSSTGAGGSNDSGSGRCGLGAAGIPGSGSLIAGLAALAMVLAAGASRRSA